MDLQPLSSLRLRTLPEATDRAFADSASGVSRPAASLASISILPSASVASSRPRSASSRSSMKAPGDAMLPSRFPRGILAPSAVPRAFFHSATDNHISLSSQGTPVSFDSHHPLVHLPRTTFPLVPRTSHVLVPRRSAPSLFSQNRRSPPSVLAAQTTTPSSRPQPSFNPPPPKNLRQGDGNMSSAAAGYRTLPTSPSSSPPSAPPKHAPVSRPTTPNSDRRPPAVIPLPPDAIAELVPRTGSGPQVLQELGTPPDWLRRGVLSLTAAVLLYNVDILATAVASLYWAWSPIWRAALKNTWLRAKFPYAGLWKARILDLQVVGTGLSATWHLVIGDSSQTTIEMDVPVPLRTARVRAGDPAELLVLSDDETMGRFRAVREAFLPTRELWVAEEGEACVERGAFEELRRRVALPEWLADPEETEEEDLDGLYSLLADENEQTISNYKPDGGAADSSESRLSRPASQAQSSASQQDYQQGGQWTTPSQAALAEDAKIFEFSALGQSMGSGEAADYQLEGGGGMASGLLGDSIGVGFGGIEVAEGDFEGDKMS